MSWCECRRPWHSAPGIVAGSRESLPSSLLRCRPGDYSLGWSLWFRDAAVEAVGQGRPGSRDCLCEIVAGAYCTVSLSPQDLDAASKLFAANCVSCHGDHGDGDGPAAGGLKPSPVNFHVRQPTADRALSVIERGIPGSSMPAWKGRLSDDERRLLAKYVLSMYDSGRQGDTRPMINTIVGVIT